MVESLTIHISRYIQHTLSESGTVYYARTLPTILAGELNNDKIQEWYQDILGKYFGFDSKRERLP